MPRSRYARSKEEELQPTSCVRLPRWCVCSVNFTQKHFACCLRAQSRIPRKRARKSAGALRNHSKRATESTPRSVGAMRRQPSIRMLSLALKRHTHAFADCSLNLIGDGRLSMLRPSSVEGLNSKLANSRPWTRCSVSWTVRLANDVLNDLNRVGGTIPGLTRALMLRLRDQLAVNPDAHLGPVVVPLMIRPCRVHLAQSDGFPCEVLATFYVEVGPRGFGPPDPGGAHQGIVSVSSWHIVTQPDLLADS
jgi:hypothetical protein